MKAIRSVAIVCDNCQRAVVRMAAPRTEANEANEAQLLAAVQDMARQHGFAHHEYLEEDHCAVCKREFQAAS